MPIRWALSAIIADFYSEYLTARAEAEAGAPVSDQRHTVSYVLNELVENAVKFNAGPQIAVSVIRIPTGLVFVVSNGVKLSDVEQVKASFAGLLAGDPGELLIRKIEKNALGGSDGSGIGFLTLMSDYGAKLGWRIEGDPRQPGLATLSTMAQLTL
jgi:hypothetical protein